MWTHYPHNGRDRIGNQSFIKLESSYVAQDGLELFNPYGLLPRYDFECKALHIIE